MTGKETIKKIALIIIAIYLILFVFTAVMNFLTVPDTADYSDVLVEDIGSDRILTAKLNHTKKINEENIGFGRFQTTTQFEDLAYYDAKNISFVDYFGNKGNMIVWKTSPDHYPELSDKNYIKYICKPTENYKGQCFIEYVPETNSVYGIILNYNKYQTEEKLVFEVLGLDPSEYSNSINPYWADDAMKNEPVLDDPEPWPTALNEPDSYYDYYEYGENPDIDDYLETQAY